MKGKTVADNDMVMTVERTDGKYWLTVKHTGASVKAPIGEYSGPLNDNVSVVLLDKAAGRGEFRK